VICGECLEKHPLLNNNGDIIKFKYINNTIYAFSKNEMNQNRECLVNGIPCYCVPAGTYQKWYIVAAMVINKNLINLKN